MPACPNCTDGTEMEATGHGTRVCPVCGYTEDHDEESY